MERSELSDRRLAGRLAASLLAMTLLGACGASTTPSAATMPAPTPSAAAAGTPSPAAITDQALVDGLAAVWSTPYDAATVAALYAPNAVLHDMVANEFSTGLEAIQAKVKKYAGLAFQVENTSAPIRQDTFVAVFQRYGTGAATEPGLGVTELKDGKVLNQWVYPAASSSAASSPAAVTDQALVDDLAAVWSTPYDAAKVAALYAPDAVVHELTEANLTSTGLEAIKARVKELSAGGFKVVVTSAPIRQDGFVAVFSTFGNRGDLSGHGLVVYELNDGKVLNQWVYPAYPAP